MNIPLQQMWYVHESSGKITPGIGVELEYTQYVFGGVQEKRTLFYPEGKMGPALLLNSVHFKHSLESARGASQDVQNRMYSFYEKQMREAQSNMEKYRPS